MKLRSLLAAAVVPVLVMGAEWQTPPGGRPKIIQVRPQAGPPQGGMPNVIRLIPQKPPETPQPYQERRTARPSTVVVVLGDIAPRYRVDRGGGFFIPFPLLDFQEDDEDPAGVFDIGEDLVAGEEADDLLGDIIPPLDSVLIPPLAGGTLEFGAGFALLGRLGEIGDMGNVGAAARARIGRIPGVDTGEISEPFRDFGFARPARPRFTGRDLVRP